MKIYSRKFLDRFICCLRVGEHKFEICEKKFLRELEKRRKKNPKILAVFFSFSSTFRNLQQFLYIKIVVKIKKEIIYRTY